MHRALEEMLAEGVEARSFARDGAPILAAAEDRAAAIREFIDKLTSVNDETSARLLAALCSLEKEEKAFRDLLADALARVSTLPPSMDWERLKREADADFAAGRFVTFTTPEGMVKDLTGSE
jgi:anaerobic glycerol-3-phosphate dehydrogenase